MLADLQGVRRFPTREILERAEFAEDAGCRFVDTEHAAIHRSLTPHTLEAYRSLGGGPVFFRFGRWVRYAIEEPAPDGQDDRIRLIPAAAAAHYLSLTLHTLKLYRRDNTGPAYYKFGRWVRYAVGDLDLWADTCRWITTGTRADAAEQQLTHCLIRDMSHVSVEGIGP
jgi:hypothetical protein